MDVWTQMEVWAMGLLASLVEAWRQAWPVVVGAAGIVGWVAKLGVEHGLKWWQSRPRFSGVDLDLSALDPTKIGRCPWGLFGVIPQ